MNARITPAPARSDLDAFWMPFTANRQFKASPRLLVAAEGVHYTSQDGRRILDGASGLWCCNAGHGRKPPIYMKPGDLIEIEATGVGRLSNPVVAADQTSSTMP